MTNEAERTAFEAWYVAQAAKAGLAITTEDMVNMRREGNTYDEGYAFLRGAWKGWQARANAQTEVDQYPVFSTSGSASPMLEALFLVEDDAKSYAARQNLVERLSPMYWYVGGSIKARPE